MTDLDAHARKIVTDVDAALKAESTRQAAEAAKVKAAFEAGKEQREATRILPLAKLHDPNGGPDQ